MRTLAIAALQTQPVVGDPEATWEAYAADVRGVRATFPHVQLVLHPELHLSAVARILEGTPGYAEDVAVRLPGPFTERLADLAEETGLWLVPGSVYERADGGDIHNTVVVVAPDRRVVATYRKVFPWQPYEKTVPGTEFVVFDMDAVGRVGLAICYDGSFPETFRTLAWMGAEVVLHPTLTTTRDRELEIVTARANAIANQVYVVTANSSAPHAVGQSLVVDPEGLVRQQAGSGREVLVDVLDLDAVPRVRRYGTLGLNRMWTQLDEHGPGVNFAMYGGPYRPRPRE
jgi:formamidase